jgi:hypothetical protein
VQWHRFFLFSIPFPDKNLAIDLTPDMRAEKDSDSEAYDFSANRDVFDRI